MKLISYEAAGAQRYGVDLGDSYVDLAVTLAPKGHARATEETY